MYLFSTWGGGSFSTSDWAEVAGLSWTGGCVDTGCVPGGGGAWCMGGWVTGIWVPGGNGTVWEPGGIKPWIEP